MLNKRGMASTSSKGRHFYGGQTITASSKTSEKGAPAPAVSPSTTGAAEAESNIIPHIRLADNGRLLPKYTGALQRSKDELLPAEDLDALQLELESLLSNVALRFRVLKSEYESLEKDEKRNDRRSKYMEKQPTSPGKRKRVEESRKPKLPQFKLAKQKLPSASSPAQSQHTDDSMDAIPYMSQHHHQKDQTKFSMPKNDTPNKFWLSVEPYCMPLTNEDLRLLDDLLDQYSGPLVPPIPELGPHFTTTWAAEDIKEEQESSNSNTNSKSRSKNAANSDTMAALKKGEKLMGESVTGPLTQRLVSALIDDSLMGDGNFNADSNSSSENTNSTNSTLRSLSLMKNGVNIEKRVKKELIEQGILDPEDLKPEEDEILSEIKRVLTELSAIAEYNSTELRRLKATGKAELQRLEVKRKLDTVDQEIVETYKKVVSAKLKRRQLTADEQEDIYRLTAEQKRLSDQLEGIPAPGPSYDD